MEKDRHVTKRIKQRDGSNAVVLRIPAGIITPESLRKIAEVAEKYNSIIKLTGAQRIAIVGIRDEDLDAFWEEVGLVPAAANGPCVRSVKVCPGKTYCKIGLQETLELGLELEKRYSGLVLPSKFKIGVSGCPNSCTEPVVKDLGFMGTKDGFTCFVGGSAGRNPRFAEVLAEGLNAEQCLEVTGKIIVYREKAEKRQFGKFIDLSAESTSSASLFLDAIFII